MSTETAAATAKKESLFSKKNRKLLVDPLDDSNPITVQVLGICSALAITVQLQQAVIMSLSVLFVMIGGNVIVSLLRNMIPDRIRIIVQLVVVASLVIIVDQVFEGVPTGHFREALRIRRFDHHQLHQHGPPRGFRLGQQARTVILGRHWKCHGLRLDSARRFNCT